jgi:hypothetical protein
MSAMLDIIGSMIIGGIILLIVLNANQVATEHAAVYSGDILVQEMLISITQVLEGEFRNMGFKVHDEALVIQTADSNHIRFLVGDPNGAGIDTIGYFVIVPESVAVADEYVKDTQNELDRFLYRRVNSGTPSAVGIVTTFNLSYYALISEDDHRLQKLSFPISEDNQRRIAAVEIELEVQNPYALFKRKDDPTFDERNALYSSSMWRQTRLTSQNLRK